MTTTTATQHTKTIAGELSVEPWRVEAAITLLDEDATVPFIARYRKEATGTLDEVQVRDVRDRFAQLRELHTRREAILKSLTERELLTDELYVKILAATNMTALEDVYLPYRPKRRTRAAIAREKGLEPLADAIFVQDGIDPKSAASEYVDPDKGVASVDEALAGARDITAERVSEDAAARARTRRVFASAGSFQSVAVAGKESDGANYRDYFDWTEPVGAAPSHRILAMFRGEKEGFLKLSVGPPEPRALTPIEDMFVTSDGLASHQVAEAVQDGYRRLMAPSLETELRGALKKRADDDAISIFAMNLRQLLLAPPLGAMNVLAIDPGFRSGCKVVCLGKQGGLLHTETVYPHSGKQAAESARRTLIGLCRRYDVEAIAIGNGTAGRETEQFVREIGLGGVADIIMVNESGASVYSASDGAREEFPDQDLTVRGAVSIGRRLMDPLAELVKIDPRSIGVGQYQHDVDAHALQDALSDVVVSCVNAVGVEVNTASSQLLSHVSGLGPQLARNIVAHAAENGPFRSREDLKAVPRLGRKAFEQAAGFLRIGDGDNPLDGSAVHPERYAIVRRMAKNLHCSVADLMADQEKRASIEIGAYVTDEVGEPTLVDIMEELSRPGRDPRDAYVHFAFDERVEKIEDLSEGMQLPGVVTNITSFGAFVDVGVHQDGLVHISQLADRYVSNPSEVVSVQQKVTVTVLEVDLERKRIALSMRKPAG
jgi:uncharacterized protein